MTQLISKGATNESKFAHTTLFYSSAREGMLDFLTHGNVEAGAILLPAYIGESIREGSGVFDPVRQSHSQFGFYGLRSDLTVDIEELTLKLSVRRYSVLVIIHYFGRTDPSLALVRQLADRYGVILVEDLAHGFFTAQNPGAAGHAGDVLLYSLHKMFPMPDGGQVVYRNRSLIGTQTETRPDLARKILDYDWPSISSTRRENFAALTGELSKLAEFDSLFHLLWPDLSDCDVPQTLPVYVNGDGRDLLYTRMNELGYGMVSLYHTLIPEVGNEFAVTGDLARHIINFPIHPDVPLASIAPMARAFGHLITGVNTTASHPKGATA